MPDAPVTAEPSVSGKLTVFAQLAVVVATAVGLLLLMGFAPSVLVPFLLAGTLVFLLRPGQRWLSKKAKLGNVGGAIVVVLAATLVLGGLIAATVGIGFFFARELTRNRGAIVAQFREWEPKINHYLGRLPGMGGGGTTQPSSQPASTPLQQMAESFDPIATIQSAFPWLTSGVGGLVTYFGLAAMGLLLALFALVSLDDWSKSVAKSMRPDVHRRWVDLLDHAARDVRHHMWATTLVGLLSGTTEAAATWLFGMPYPLVWGLLAFLLNYLPNIGSLISSATISVVALFVLGPAKGLALAAVVLTLENSIGNLLAPILYGRGLNISAFASLASLIVWGWLFGIVGALLAVPLTTILVRIVSRLLSAKEELLPEFLRRAAVEEQGSAGAPNAPV